MDGNVHFVFFFQPGVWKYSSRIQMSKCIPLSYINYNCSTVQLLSSGSSTAYLYVVSHSDTICIHACDVLKLKQHATHKSI